MAKYKRDTVSGPVKSFFEGLAGVAFVATLICIFGIGVEAIKAILAFGAISIVSYGISTLFRPKNRFTEK